MNRLENVGGSDGSVRVCGRIGRAIEYCFFDGLGSHSVHHGYLFKTVFT